MKFECRESSIKPLSQISPPSLIRPPFLGEEGHFKAFPLFKASLPSLLIPHYQVSKRWADSHGYAGSSYLFWSLFVIAPGGVLPYISYIGMYRPIG